MPFSYGSARSRPATVRGHLRRPRALAAFVLAGMLLAPAASSATPSVEVESLRIPAGKGRIFPDDRASGGRAVLLWAQSAIRLTVDGPSARVSVRVRASRCGGEAPHLRIRLDGRTVTDTGITSTRWTTVGTRAVPAGKAHVIELAYTNDFQARRCVRSLRLDVIRGVSSPAAGDVSAESSGPEPLFTSDGPAMEAIAPEAPAEEGPAPLATDVAGPGEAPEPDLEPTVPVATVPLPARTTPAPTRTTPPVRTTPPPVRTTPVVTTPPPVPTAPGPTTPGTNPESAPSPTTPPTTPATSIEPDPQPPAESTTPAETTPDEGTTPAETTPEETTPEETTPEATTPEATTPTETTPEATTPEAATPEETTPETTTPDETQTPEPTSPESTTPEETTPSSLYVAPQSDAAAQAEAWRESRPDDAALMDELAAQPGALWIDDAVADPRATVEARVSAAAAAGATPVLVLSAMPGRGCGGYPSGRLSGPAQYDAWLTQVATGIADRPAIVVIEPGALDDVDCLDPASLDERYGMLGDAVNQLSALPATRVYLGAGHAGGAPASVMAERLIRSGIGSATGFAFEIGHSGPTAAALDEARTLSSLVDDRPFVIDTGRGGTDAAGDGCNAAGRRLGARPTLATGEAGADAYLWISPIGVSDGPCNGGPDAGVWWAEYALDMARQPGW